MHGGTKKNKNKRKGRNKRPSNSNNKAELGPTAEQIQEPGPSNTTQNAPPKPKP
jgi:hypothetical protein